MINVKNIYWMLAYAFKSVIPKDEAKIQSESFENIYDLFSVMLSQALNKLIKSGLNRAYIEKEELCEILRGKILVNESIKQNTMTRNRLVCKYDEYSINSYLNRIIKTAAIKLIDSKKIDNQKHKNELKKSISFLHDVNLIDTNSINWKNIKYNQNNVAYKFSINISYLILKSLILKDEKGNEIFNEFIDEQEMNRLYEKFLLEYYRYHYKNLLPGNPKIRWDFFDEALENSESNDKLTIEKNLFPSMQTDLVLQQENRKLIIDAKYYNSIFQKNYEVEKYKSNNLYQIFTYVKNMDTGSTGNVSGMLLYAQTEEQSLKWNVENISGNRFIVYSVDLDSEFVDIENRLHEIAEKFLKDEI